MLKMKLILCGVCAVLLGAAVSGAQGDEPKPNIIIVLCDDLGIGDVSSFNTQGKIRTPNFDALASGGMKFTDAHTRLCF